MHSSLCKTVRSQRYDLVALLMDSHVWVPMHLYQNFVLPFHVLKNIKALKNLKQNSRRMILPTWVIQIQLTNSTKVLLFFYAPTMKHRR
jgi:hypothetical protein